MTNLLIKLFIKDHDNTKNSYVRENYGVFAGIIGIICNVILFSGKFFAGIITGAISITADAFNNLSDAGSSIVTLVGFKIAGKPADKDHPFGHGRIEYVAGLFVSLLILLMGFELGKSSIEKIINPEIVEFSLISIVILSFSIVLKCWMYFFNKTLSKKISSEAMMSTAKDSLSYTVATSAVVIVV
ncbi:MAG: cation diffusion facilitator family transporter, partial [Oscillospiraceae bacterium]